MVDRRRQAAREHISRSIADGGDIQGPETDSHDQRVSGAGSLRKRERDSSVRRGLEAERRLLYHCNRGETIYREGIGENAGLVVGVGDGYVTGAKRSAGADGDAGRKLSGRAKSA